MSEISLKTRRMFKEYDDKRDAGPMIFSGSSAGRSGISATIISPFWPLCSINSGAHSVEYHLECGMAAISISRKRGTSAMTAARVAYFIT